MRTLLVPALAIAMASCSPHKVTHNPAPPVELPKAYTHIAEAGANLPDRWWQDFGDPKLNQLVEAALTGNLQVKAAWERVMQSRAAAKAAGAGRFPTLQMGGQVLHQEPANPFVPLTPLSFQAAYEVDIFRKNWNASDAGKLNVRTAQDQVQSVAMTLVAQIADTWFSLVAQSARLKLLEEQIGVSEDFLELAELRLGQGLGSSLDVLQQRQQLAQISLQRAPIESAIAVLRNQLALLTGVVPGALALEPGDALPALPPRPSAGVPTD